jgi:hypothetical protein
MEKSKINTMFDKFLVQLLASEATEEDEVIEQPEQPKLVEAPATGWTSKYDEYMFGLVNKIIEDYGLEQEVATEIVQGVAGVLVGRKHLPAMPKGSATVESLAAWVEAAEKIGFAKHVIGITDKMVQEAVKETDPDDGDDDSND